ncbi:hypothetical protein BDN72DRAFT_227803 [Pluteus cervinus]|uniref:Uncharacterized protein n=1 Tax=Pluteus cervinus TaxID=181527 RepID=A0ACD3BE26_9AGAR|nr:hypothetical protein BDN72DRAFT_227803 [Pluteus cervinus]
MPPGGTYKPRSKYARSLSPRRPGDSKTRRLRWKRDLQARIDQGLVTGISKISRGVPARLHALSRELPIENAIAALPVPIPETSDQESEPLILDYGAITAFPTMTFPEPSVNPTPPAISSFLAQHRLSTHSHNPTLPAGKDPQVTQSFSSFSQLPALPSRNSVPHGPTATHVPAISTPTGEQSTLDEVGPPAGHGHGAQGHHKLSTAVIVLLAVGAGCICIGLLLVFKFCCRRNRCTRPLPSLPILHDLYRDSKLAVPDSPLFGGNERHSTRSVLGANYVPWTQYPRPKLSSDDISQITPLTSGSALKAQEFMTTPIKVPGTPILKDQSLPSQTPTNSPRQGPFTHFHNALNRAASRISEASMSLYPGSPMSNISGHDNIGLAISEPMNGTAFTADGHKVLARARSKASLHKSRSNSIADEARDQDAMYYRYSQGMAYDGADVSSPSIATRIQAHPAQVIVSPPTASVGGRTRIKSTYIAPGSYPRISTAQSTGNNVFDTPSLPPAKPEYSRAHDTEALTHALGLSTPAGGYKMAASSRPSLSPDDSVSIREAHRVQKGGRTHKRNVSEAGDRRFTLHSMTSNLDTSSLGSLMLVDFAAEKLQSLSDQDDKLHTSTTNRSLTAGVKQSTDSNQKTSPPSRKNTNDQQHQRDDRPPRVPSPPPIPSLAQMALEHADPQSYSDYRSPTYSIYGLYEHERKSRTFKSTVNQN